ncbi:MAG TPA: type II toxin-antitoxin system ParD family antitoxin [Rhizomicrobium sp.]|nr:type II toxin-antitoxin system ParD family antitoxin [Rhizomicrobium sp.]
MGAMHVSLPDFLREWVEKEIKSGRYASASDYFSDLIRRDQAARHALEEALAEGAASGPSTRTIPEIIRDTKARLANGG